MICPILSYTHDEYGTVRATLFGDDVWFIGLDVAKALGFTNPAKALDKFVTDKDKVCREEFSEFEDDMVDEMYISLGGFLTLARNCKAKRAWLVKLWIVGTVLRETEMYGL